MMREEEDNYMCIPMALIHLGGARAEQIQKARKAKTLSVERLGPQPYGWAMHPKP